MTGTELVIFDCDGVLVDSEPLAIKIDLLILERFGLPMTEQEVIERFVGRSPDTILEAIEAHVGHPLERSWEEEFQPLYLAAYETALEPVPGIRQALDQITLPTCVASSSKLQSLRYKLELTGLYERFAGRIYSATQVAHGKPAPDLFLYAAEQLGASPPGCVVVEDSRHGVAAGRAAGMHVLAYAGGVTPASALEGRGTTVFHHMDQLPALLASMDTR
jgi:HAD superfamily hydrolase (TIGR01509 family)